LTGEGEKWTINILEFDLEINPTKLIKGQGLDMLLVESNCKVMGVKFINIFSENQQVELPNGNPHDIPPLEECAWYKDIIHFLQELRLLDAMGKSRERYLNLKAIRYCLIDQVLYWKDPLGVLLRCLDPQEAQRIMSNFHSSLSGGHHFWKTTTYKILRVGYYWTTLFTYVCRKIRSCIKCKKFSGKQQLKSLPLKPVVAS
jgi:hypothetical protein